MKFRYGFMEVSPQNALIPGGHRARWYKSQDHCVQPHFCNTKEERNTELEWFKEIYPGRQFVCFELTSVSYYKVGDEVTMNYTDKGLIQA